MQQYIYGNIGHKDYAYVSSEPGFFNNAQRAAVLSHLMSYDVSCRHGDLNTGEHQSYWMVASNLDNPAAAERLYIQASGCEAYRNSIYVRGYLSDSEDGYLYDDRFLRLLRTKFTGLEQTMQAAEANDLKRVDWDQLAVDTELQPAKIDKEVLRTVLLALMRKKKVILRIPAVGAEAMRQSREYILAIYERLPYEQRKVNGFVTGTHAPRLNSTNALPAAINLILMDGDANIAGLTTDSNREIIDLAGEEPKFRPMPREIKGTVLGHVKLIDFLAETDPEELDAFFRFCRGCMRGDVDGHRLGILDYTMYLEFFGIGRTRFTDDSIRSWAGNIYVNAKDNRMWTADVKRVLFQRITETMPLEQLEDYLLRQVTAFDNIRHLGFLTEADLRRIRSNDASEQAEDQNAALTLIMTNALLAFYPEGSGERLLQSLLKKFVRLGGEKYPCLTEPQPTAETVAQAEKIQLPVHSRNTTPLADKLKAQVNAELEQLRKQVGRIYTEQYSAQHASGLAMIASWPGENNAELPELYAELKRLYLWEELLPVGEKSGWNGAIGERIADFCRKQVVLDAAACKETLDYVNRTCRYFLEQGGQISDQLQAQIRSITDGWKFLLELHKTGNPEEKMGMLATLERLAYPLNNYSKDAWESLVRMVFAAFMNNAVQLWPELTEEKPRYVTVQRLKELQLPLSGQEGTQDPCVILRDRIYGQLRSLREEVGAQYAKQRETQKEAGLARIGRWPEGAEALTALYEDLKELYLYEELIRPEDASGWNNAIGDRIAAQCAGCAPQTLEDYAALLKLTDSHCGTFAANGGVLTPAHNDTIQKAKTEWRGILELSEKDCVTLEELLTLFAETGERPMVQSLRDGLKVRFTKRLLKHGVTRNQIFPLCEKLCEASRDALERKLLHGVVDSCDNVNEIGQLSLEKLMVCLKMLSKLERAGLLTKETVFHPWAVRSSARELLVKIAALKDYKAGAPEPDLTDKRIRVWVLENLRGNTELMLLLARRFPEYRESLIPELAQKPGAVNRDQILALYVAGCPKAMLCRGAEAMTVESWRRNIEDLFPEWTELPEPVNLVLPSGLEWLNVLLIGNAILLALASLLPAGLMLAMDAFLMLPCLIVAGVLVVAALLLLVISFPVRKKAQKLYLRIMAASMVPGIVATVVCLVMNMK